MTGRLRRPVVVLSALVLFCVVLVAATRTWVRATLPSAVGGLQSLDVTGSQAAPVVAACALTGLAGAGALSIAGRRARTPVLAVLAAVALAAAAASAGVLRDASAAVRTQVAEALAVTPDSVRPGTADVAPTGWVWVALVAALAAAVLAGAAVVAARSWPGGDRFAPAASSAGATRAAPAPAMGDDAHPDAATSWDALTAGVDPTGPPMSTAADAPADPAPLGGPADPAPLRGPADPAPLRGDGPTGGGRMGAAGLTDGGTPHG